MCEHYTRHKLCWTTSVRLLKQDYNFLSQDTSITHYHWRCKIYLQHRLRL